MNLDRSLRNHENKHDSEGPQAYRMKKRSHFHIKSLKNSYKRVPRLRASFRHGGADYRFLSEEIDPPRGRPFGGGGIHRNRGYGGNNSHHHIGKNSSFVGNHRESSVVLGVTNLIRDELGEEPEVFRPDRFQRILMSSSLPHGSDEPFGGARGDQAKKVFYEAEIMSVRG